MKATKFQWILYSITATIITTIAVQFYWNYKNYEQNKQRIRNEIQLSLNNAVEQYYADLSKKSFIAIINSDTILDSKNKKPKIPWDSIFKSFPKPKKTKSNSKVTLIETSKTNKIDSIFISINKTVKKQNTDTSLLKKGASSITQFSINDKSSGYNLNKAGTIEKVKVFRGKRATDSLKLIKGLKPIFISMSNDSLEYQKVDSILQKELDNKKISVPFYLNHFKEDTLYYTTKTKIEFPFKSSSKSTFLKSDELLEIAYTNPTKEALKRSSTGILLSLLLSLAVISSLFYLLKIINQQKELAEIKNDLISNITHEFKTPITTVSTALEAINNFNVINDKEKTQTYVDISKNQVEKLHLMVEKLLETATLDSEKLLLKKEEINLVSIVEKLTKKHQLITSKKEISFNSSMNEITTTIDVFHFENAISNLIDNAIKYGGDKIDIHLSTEGNKIIIEVSDNGKGIEKTQQDKIFDKFYRIPKGNTHDVKGFGIGLYYTKKIIEKHNGTISLKSNSKQTIFSISLPYEY